jgi:spore coat polysaccharide biosynthesis protein SpsF
MSEKVLGVLQARMSSSRLPGKVLSDVAGKPMILRQLERIKVSQALTEIVVATSRHTSDDSLVEILQQNEVSYFRGSLENVASRFLEVIRLHEPHTVVRLTADCPLTDPDVIDLVVEQHFRHDVDYTSNTLRRTFPKGLDVEVFASASFEALIESGLDEYEAEHVTPGFYNGRRDFRVHSVEQAVDYSRSRWTVDYPEDLDFVRNVYSALSSFRGTFKSSDIMDAGLRNRLEVAD